MDTEKHTFQKNIDTAKFCKEYEAATGLKLMADYEGDTVDGYVNTDGANIEVHFYKFGCTDDSKPCPHGKHRAKLRKPTITAAETQKLQSTLDSHTK